MSKDRQRYSVRARNRISQGGSTVASPWACRYRKAHGDATRSEEHTSELQSLLHLVCRLLLEKKRNFVRLLAHDEGVGLPADGVLKLGPSRGQCVGGISVHGRLVVIVLGCTAMEPA